MSKLRDDLKRARNAEIDLLAQLVVKDKEIKRLRKEKEELEDNFEENLSKALKKKETELREMMMKHEKIMSILISDKKKWNFRPRLWFKEK